MNPEQKEFLNLRTFPARLNVDQAGWFLGFNKVEMGILMATRLIHPLGRPRNNSTKYFSLMELEALRADPKWLARATDAVSRYWHHTNLNKAKRRLRLANNNPLGEAVEPYGMLNQPEP